MPYLQAALTAPKPLTQSDSPGEQVPNLNQQESAYIPKKKKNYTLWKTLRRPKTLTPYVDRNLENVRGIRC